MRENELETRKTQSEWAEHLETCMDPECETCKAFETKIYGN